MKIEIQLDDDVFAAYQADAHRRKVGVVHLLAEQLERFRDYSTLDRVVVVGPDERQELEDLFHQQVRDAAHLVQLAGRLAEVKIGTVRVDFSPAQLEELKRRAEGSGKTVQQVVEEKYAEVARGFFNSW